MWQDSSCSVVNPKIVPICWILEMPFKLLMESSTVPLQRKHHSFLFLIHAIHMSLESCAFDELPFMRHLDALTNILIIWHRSNATVVRFQSETRTVRFVNMVKRKLESGQRTNDVHSRRQQLLHGI